MKTLDGPKVGERKYPEQMTDRDKAAFILGMVWAFSCVGWPLHFNEDALAGWIAKAQTAEQMLCGGAFNPLHAYALLDLANEELCIA